MGLLDRVNSGVDRAFKKIDDLMVDVILKTSGTVSFELETNDVAEQSAFTLRRAFLAEKLVYLNGGLVKQNTALLRSDGTDYSMYDALTAGSIVYNIVSAADNGFSTKLELSRV